MMRFPCKSCGQKLTVDEKYAGKRVKCPKCGSIGVVPDKSDKIKFHCDSCGQSISVPNSYAGKKGRCPKCKTPIVVPSPDSEPVESSAYDPPIPSGSDDDAYADEYSYEDESDPPDEEEDGSLDRRVLFAIGGAAVVVVGLIILVAVFLLSGPRVTPKAGVSPQQEVADASSRSDSRVTDAPRPAVSTPQPPKEDIVPTGAAPSSPTASDNAGRLDMRLRLQPGQKRNLRLVRNVKSSQTLDGRQSDSNSVNTTGLVFEVERIDANNVAWVKVTYRTIHDVTTTARGRSEYDSTRPETATNHPVASLFSALVGQSFTAKITPDGEIVESAGLDDMYRRMAGPATRGRAEEAGARGERVLPPPTEERINSTRKWLEMHSYVGKQAIAEMLSDVIMLFPDEAVGIGESWETETPLPKSAIGLSSVPHSRTYRLRETTQEAALVDIDSTIERDDDFTSEEDRPGGVRSIALTGSCQGSAEIDLSTGWLLHKKITLTCSGEIKTAPSDRHPQGRTIRISTEITTTVEPLE